MPIATNGQAQTTVPAPARGSRSTAARKAEAADAGGDLARIEQLEASRRDAEADFAALTTVLDALAAASSTEQAIQAALNSVRQSFGWAYGSFWALDRRDAALKFAAESGDAGEEFAKVTRAASFREGVGLSGRAWKNRDLFFTPDIGEMTDCVRAPIAQKIGVKSGVCFPVIVGGDVVGTMDFFTTETLHPSPQRLDALRSVGRMVSQSIERIQGEEANREIAADTGAVAQVLGALSAASTSSEAATAALNTVRESFGWAYGSYWAIDPSDRALKFVVESGNAGEEFARVTRAASFKEGVGLSGRAWQSRDLFFTPDIGEMTDCVRAPVAQKIGVKSGVCFPILVEGEVIGTMDFFTTETIEPSPARLDALRNVGRLVSQSFARIRGEEGNREIAADTAAVAEVLGALSAAHTSAEAATAALDTVRESFGWAYGSYWSVDPADHALKFVVESGNAGEEFARVTRAASFKEGVGLSGRAWQSRDLFFTPDIGEMTDCVRAPVAQKIGVKSGVCFPIVVAGAVVGTMDFFTTETISPRPTRLDALRNVGRLVSQSFERIGNEEAERAAADTLRGQVDQMLNVVSAAAAGDLTRDITVSGDDAIGQMGEGLAAFFTTLRASMSEIGHTAQALAAAGEELSAVSEQMIGNATSTSSQAESASGISSEVASNIETVATAADQMTASIAEIARNASSAADVAGQAVEGASSANRTVSNLGDSSQEIGKVIKVITSIAQQTNLLALNATIEAARAGEAGKGFAVVANEVKELAKETARATEDISQKIEAIQADTTSAVTAIGQISTVINQISDIQNTISSAVEEQTATTNEIARSVSAAASGSQDISRSITTVAEAAQSTRQGAEDSQRAAAELAAMAAELQRLLGQFQF
ncbi:MAG: GAF domain-containing protein [Sporichthyaceae bacterium]